MTCKDCIHYDLCRSCSRIQLGWHGNSVHYVENIEEICKDFKDRSRFVELPCKAGDRVYAAFPKAEAIIEYVIVSIWVEEAGVSVRAVDTAFFTYGFFMAHEFGQKLFFTKKEAEQALKEREENDK